MKLTKKQHTEIYKHLKNISKMTLDDLRAFAQKWHFNKPDLDEKVHKFVSRGLDSQMSVLMERTDISPMAVLSEIGEVREEDG